MLGLCGQAARLHKSRPRPDGFLPLYLASAAWVLNMYACITVAITYNVYITCDCVEAAVPSQRERELATYGRGCAQRGGRHRHAQGGARPRFDPYLCKQMYH